MTDSNANTNSRAVEHTDTHMPMAYTNLTHVQVRISANNQQPQLDLPTTPNQPRALCSPVALPSLHGNGQKRGNTTINGDMGSGLLKWIRGLVVMLRFQGIRWG